MRGMKLAQVTGNMNIVRQNAFAVVEQVAGHTDAVLLLYRIHPGR